MRRFAAQNWLDSLREILLDLLVFFFIGVLAAQNIDWYKTTGSSPRLVSSGTTPEPYALHRVASLVHSVPAALILQMILYTQIIHFRRRPPLLFCAALHYLCSLLFAGSWWGGGRGSRSGSSSRILHYLLSLVWWQLLDCACVPLKFYLKNSRRAFLDFFSSLSHTLLLSSPLGPRGPEARSSTPFALISSRVGSRDWLVRQWRFSRVSCRATSSFAPLRNSYFEAKPWDLNHGVPSPMSHPIPSHPISFRPVPSLLLFCSALLSGSGYAAVRRSATCAHACSPSFP